MKHPIASRPARAVASVVLFMFIALQGMFAQAAGQGPLPGKNIPKYVDPLPTFVGGRVDGTQPLTIRMVEKAGPNRQQVLPTPFGPTTVWAYEINEGGTRYGPLYPAVTVEARRGVPTQVTYENALENPTIPFWRASVDQSLHWADPPPHQHHLWSPDYENSMFMPIAVPAPPEFAYTGPVPAVVHLHGGEVSSKFDGGPDAWFTPGIAHTGPGYVSNVYTYPNDQLAATLWYHDHALGITRLNVYAGMAGFYFLRDDVDTGLPTNPLGLPSGAQEIEIVIQDRMFDQQGEFLYPVGGTDPTLHPFWQPEFFGDVIVVNGKSWPFLNVEPRRYRFRFLNGSNSRVYSMALQGVKGGSGPAFYQIGTDGGLMAAPVPIAYPNRLLLAPGERADVIVDFAGIRQGTTFTLVNNARSPFPGGAPPDPQTVGQIMQFRVALPFSGVDNTYNPALPGATLRPLTPLSPLNPAKTRQLTLNEVMAAAGPYEALLNNTKWDGTMSPGANAIFTEMPLEGTTEVWQIINTTADAHPIHLHLVQFQLVSRQKFQVNKFLKAYSASFTGSPSWFDPMMGMFRPYLPGEVIPGYGPPSAYDTPNGDGAIGGNPAITPYLQGPPSPPKPNEVGWKDTFIMYPGEVTTVVVRFSPQDDSPLFSFNPEEGPGYVWHCHILEHEDNEMMRPYKVVASPLRTAGVIAAEGGLEQIDLGRESLGLPAQFELSQNYPNPFNPATEIRFSLPDAAHVSLTVYNSVGQVVKTLIDADAPAGFHTVKLDGRGLSSGIYYYRIQAGSYTDVKSMVLLK